MVVLAAAYAHAHDAVQDIPLKGMQDSYDTNVIGNWNLVKAVLKNRTASSGQAIILNVSSFAAYRTLPRQSAYGPSKGAFTQIMSEFATEYKESDARFVSFHPGAIWTDLTERGFGSKDIFEGWEDVTLPGHFAVWLASLEADFLHGRFVWAQWDVDELIELKEKIQSDPYALKIGLSQVDQ